MELLYNKGDEKLRWQTQLAWMRNSNGDLDIDYIGRFENLQSTWEHVQSTLGIDDKLPHLYKTTVKDYREEYTDETRDMIAEVHAEDIERFGYKF